MKVVVRFTAVALLALTLAACGKTSEQKAQNKAKDLIEEQNEIARYLNRTGEPSSSWSEEDLKTYEAKLNRLEQVESELAVANGSNGVTVIGGNNAVLIARLRSKIASAREEKARPKSREYPSWMGQNRSLEN